ncbi:hypothetical protein A3H85_02665 [Candidatus Daviesbacteria bacterium RIFCSPLOWO2_02_FULL_40_8]|uniref:Uncharacterized protein n=1 Tax=Candidatus Daviesbacteria bacterium RIFCSPLOWO2_01_FULL_40_24 TaxID=1797787 RepID=A0A1F5MII3_9BACT|nr:MAG: hypothetical protein A2780_03395 [Candidatus Daviesbacteria bacterium RIFCSPHIGHO2_01_FULL_41_45]OGE34190.1 MAG: hypothetical protein A3C32_00480 [Candidatus Daviesbacteria bacterium RIFCSPHIGHO2_02_FULL_41_14]OGE65174.1 MAG: hypothetical protein A3B49_01430 [Candidatus Daviesbacteria bacterium RIFCSPLOWO2_01_FULL_40_24]OGE66877.1 MAG: hypothetical protein A3H85_02665 [Candidatus Daviesbacteria bacterium RIFCSPLOWO2_02_FULL_40_8]
MDDNQQTLTPTDETSTTSVAMNLEAMIKANLSTIDRLSEELKKQKEMLQSVFENDETFKKHSDVAKEAARIKSNTKQQILKQPQVADVNEKVKSMQSQLKENQDALSEYLREYNRLTGITEIEGNDGEIRQIIYIAKLIRKT